MEFRKYKAVIFDLDGTLMNTLPDIAFAGNFALAALGFPQYAETDYRKLIGEGTYTLCEGLLPKAARSKENADKVFELYMGAYGLEKSIPYEGIIEAVSGIPVPACVLSNKGDKEVKELVRQHFGSLFKIVLGAREGVPVKPDPTAALEIAAELGVASHEILFVGDMVFDKKTADNAGMDFCGVLWGFGDREEIADANILLSSPEELCRIF